MRNKEIAELFGTIADSFMALRDLYAASTDEKPQQKATKKDKPAKQSKQMPVANTEKETSTETTIYTKEDVRSMLAQKAKADGGRYKADVKGIVAKFSSDGTLTGVPEEKYPELVADLEVIGNA